MHQSKFSKALLSSTTMIWDNHKNIYQPDFLLQALLNCVSMISLTFQYLRLRRGRLIIYQPNFLHALLNRWNASLALYSLDTSLYVGKSSAKLTKNKTWRISCSCFSQLGLNDKFDIIYTEQFSLWIERRFKIIK